jgi:hypothetical protein
VSWYASDDLDDRLAQRGRGDAALLVDPLDFGAMTKAIQKVDAESDLRAELGQRGAERAKLFSPDVYQQRVGILYRSVLGSTASHTSR